MSSLFYLRPLLWHELVQSQVRLQMRWSHNWSVLLVLDFTFAWGISGVDSWFALVRSVFGCKKVECLLLQPCTLQKLSVGQSRTKWPSPDKQLMQSFFARTRSCRSLMDCLRNFSLRDNQWSALHKGHLDFVGNFPPRVEKPLAYGPSLLALLLSGLLLLSFTILPKIGCVAALALAVTNAVISWTVTSLSSFSTIRSTVSRHFSLRP